MSTCDRCGSACQGRLCRDCAMIQRVEAAHGTDSTPETSPGDATERAVDDVEEWAVQQTGLDGSAEGQATLDGGITKPTEVSDGD